jgi:hypothetical protein
MVPYVPGLGGQGLQQLRQFAASPGPAAEIGNPEQLVVERELADRQRATVLKTFARDALFIRSLLGHIAQLSALGPAHDAPDYANLSVHMANSDGVVASWSSLPGRAGAGVGLTLVGRTGVATLRLHSSAVADERPSASEIQDDAPVDRWELSVADQTHTFAGGFAVDAHWVVDELSRQINGGQPRVSWEEACHVTELSEVVGLSLRRGKTVELHSETVTEEDTFKGVMAVGGCGALLLVLLLVLGLALLDSIPWFNHPALVQLFRTWPVVLVIVLGIFLVLQCLRFVFPSRSSDTGPSRQERET